MKLKRIAEDFQVEEQISLAANGGEFALYRLTKQSLGTPEAVDAIRQKWNLRQEAVAFAGLKDKHALTTQLVTIHGGPRRNLAQTSLELKYVGQTDRPIHASDITANRFAVVIRDLSASELEAAIKQLSSIAQDGLPNYFDNQRFGSLGESGEFLAKPWCLGDYERAMWLALADPNVHDQRRDLEEKQILRDLWGDWPQCMAKLPQSPAKPIIVHLARNPRDFRRAITLIRQDLRSLWLAAFQSHLWNQVLAALIRQVCRPDQCTTQPIAKSELPFFTSLDPAQRAKLHGTLLPLPSARLHLDASPFKPLYDHVLTAEGMELRQVRVKYPRDSFFSKGDRPATFQPGSFEHDAAADELYAGQQKLTLRFTLPRGAYATILVKQIAGAAADSLADES